MAILQILGIYQIKNNNISWVQLYIKVITLKTQEMVWNIPIDQVGVLIHIWPALSNFYLAQLNQLHIKAHIKIHKLFSIYLLPHLTSFLYKTIYHVEGHNITTLD
ncbi:hypothetical protein ACJX0J_012128, partial [Zea mays]